MQRTVGRLRKERGKGEGLAFKESIVRGGVCKADANSDRLLKAKRNQTLGPRSAGVSVTPGSASINSARRSTAGSRCVRGSRSKIRMFKADVIATLL